ncbi:hypothetical protein [Arthrobacter cupressi]|uniref:hypothetical protein n=1 Tax=Arthrobacter cupressi TaxID=1045773 RepID=UPI000944F3C4|nr:hypothetical protein [Arthrobacter cupressi]NYD77843.1 hypothetical protein [Arthrobacter cupressi]
MFDLKPGDILLDHPRVAGPALADFRARGFGGPEVIQQNVAFATHGGDHAPGGGFLAAISVAALASLTVFATAAVFRRCGPRVVG